MSNERTGLPGKITRIAVYGSQKPLDIPFVTVENLPALHFVCFGLTFFNEGLSNGGTLRLQAYDNNGQQVGQATYLKSNRKLFLVEEQGELKGFLELHRLYLLQHPLSDS